MYVLVDICVVSTFKIQERRKEHWWETCKFEMYKKQNNHQWLTPSFVTQWYSHSIQTSSNCHRLKSFEMHSNGAGRQSAPRHGAWSTSCSLTGCYWVLHWVLLGVTGCHIGCYWTLLSVTGVWLFVQEFPHGGVLSNHTLNARIEHFFNWTNMRKILIWGLVSWQNYPNLQYTKYKINFHLWKICFSPYPLIFSTWHW